MGFQDLDIDARATNVATADGARILKIQWNGELRRVRYEVGTSNLHQILSETFGLKNPAKIMLDYLDAEGDTVTLSTDAELHELLTSFPNIAFRFEAHRRTPPLANLQQLQKAAAPVKVAEKKKNLNKEKKEKKTQVGEKKEKAAAAPNAEKKPKDEKEKAKQLQKKLDKWQKKIIRLRIALGNPEKQVPHKFFGAKTNGKLVSNACLGIKGLWTLYMTRKGEVLLSSLNAPGRFLCVGPKGNVHLNGGGIGKRARWQLFSKSTGEQLTFATLSRSNIVLVNQLAGTRLAVVSAPNTKAEIVMTSQVSAPRTQTSFFLGLVQDELKIVQKLALKLQQTRAQKKLNRRLRLGQLGVAGPNKQEQAAAPKPNKPNKPNKENKEKKPKENKVKEAKKAKRASAAIPAPAAPLPLPSA